MYPSLASMNEIGGFCCLFFLFYVLYFLSFFLFEFVLCAMVIVCE